MTAKVPKYTRIADIEALFEYNNKCCTSEWLTEECRVYLYSTMSDQSRLPLKAGIILTRGNLQLVTSRYNRFSSLSTELVPLFAYVLEFAARCYSYRRTRVIGRRDSNTIPSIHCSMLGIVVWKGQREEVLVGSAVPLCCAGYILQLVLSYRVLGARGGNTY